MPSGHPAAMAAIAYAYQSLAPRSILDVGIGHGRFGWLAREYLDFLPSSSPDKQLRLDGIELFEPYIGPLQRTLYGHIYLGDALSVLKTIEHRYDLIVCVDMIEHLATKDGEQLLREFQRVANTSLVATPPIFLEQHATHENEAEEHVSFWSEHDFSRLGAAGFLECEDMTIALFGSGEAVSRLIPIRTVKDVIMHDLLPPALARALRRMRRRQLNRPPLALS